MFGVGCGDRAAAAAEEPDVRRALGVEPLPHLGEKLDVAAVVARKPDGAHVFLHRRAHDLRRRAVVAEINDLDPVADEFEVDRVDGAVVPVADGHGGQQAEGGGSCCGMATVLHLQMSLSE